MIDACIAGLLRYAEDTGLIEADDRLWARNRLLEALQLDGCDPDCAPAELPLAGLGANYYVREAFAMVKTVLFD